MGFFLFYPFTPPNLFDLSRSEWVSVIQNGSLFYTCVEVKSFDSSGIPVRFTVVPLASLHQYQLVLELLSYLCVMMTSIFEHSYMGGFCSFHFAREEAEVQIGDVTSQGDSVNARASLPPESAPLSLCSESTLNWLAPFCSEFKGRKRKCSLHP